MLLPGRFQTWQVLLFYLYSICLNSSFPSLPQTIRQTQPDVVMVELCSGRVSILQLDEEKLLEEAKNINFEKIRLVIKQVSMSVIIICNYESCCG